MNEPKKLTSEQQRVVDFLNLETLDHEGRHDLDIRYLEQRPNAWANWSPNGQTLYRTAKAICVKVFLPNPRASLRDCIQCTLATLLEPTNAKTFSDLPEKKRLAFVIATTRKISHAVVRRRPENQYPEFSSDPDHSVKSSNRNDRGLLTGKVGESAYVVEYVPPRRVDWIKANREENELIARIDRERAALAEPEPETEFERCVRVLGAKDADFYWSIKFENDSLPQRHPDRKARTSTDRKRYQRLKQKLESKS